MLSLFNNIVSQKAHLQDERKEEKKPQRYFLPLFRARTSAPGLGSESNRRHKTRFSERGGKNLFDVTHRKCEREKEPTSAKPTCVCDASNGHMQSKLTCN